MTDSAPDPSGRRDLPAVIASWRDQLRERGGAGRSLAMVAAAVAAVLAVAMGVAVADSFGGDEPAPAAAHADSASTESPDPDGAEAAPSESEEPTAEPEPEPESEPDGTTSDTLSEPTVQVSGHSSGTDSITLDLTYDDGGGKVTCDLLRDGAVKVGDGSCDSLTEDGLRASTEHTYRVRITNAAGDSTTGDYRASTATVKGQVYFGCSEMDTAYCDDTSAAGGGNGIGLFDNPDRNGSPIGHVRTGDRYRAICWTTGPSITPRGQEADGYHDYHPGKDTSNKQILLGDGDYYIPFAWFNIDGVAKNSVGDLPPC